MKGGEQMVYVQLKNRVVLLPGTPLRVQHVADICGENHADINSLLKIPLECVTTPGIWRIPAIHVAKTLSENGYDIQVLGAVECFVHYIPENKQNKTHALRSIIAFILLFAGSMLAITWFHADVNMAQAQQQFFKIITGRDASNPLLITIPYAIGVFLGVALFYALLGKKGTISPLEIKLNEYHSTSEKAIGKTP
ncbi:MAG: hypothetical protein IJN44_00020 [Clostridia bacterium]|nr:hypothetical protein [Clostridia bacterium]